MSDHHHHHHDEHKHGGEMSEMDKLAHLLSHWREHNNDHASNYRNWADKANGSGKLEAAVFLRQAADMTDHISEIFAKAEEALKK